MQTVQAEKWNKGPAAISTERLLPGDQAHALEKLFELYQELFLHDGFGEIRVRMRLMKKGQKEVVIQFGKEFRFVVDCPHPSAWD